MRRWPSAIVSFGPPSRRRLRSRSAAAQLSTHSRCPLVTASTCFCPARPPSEARARPPCRPRGPPSHNPVRPEVHERQGSQIALLPRGVLRLPSHRIHGDRQRRARRLGWEYVHVASPRQWRGSDSIGEILGSTTNRAEPFSPMNRNPGFRCRWLIRNVRHGGARPFPAVDHAGSAA